MASEVYRSIPGFVKFHGARLLRLLVGEKVVSFLLKHCVTAGVLHVNVLFKVPRAAYRSINVGGGGGPPGKFWKFFFKKNKKKH